MGVHPPVRRGRARARLLARGVRAGLDRSRVAAGHPAVDRPVRPQEPGPHARTRYSRCSLGRARRQPTRMPHPAHGSRSPAQVVRDGPPVDPRAPLVVQGPAGTGSRTWAASSRLRPACRRARGPPRSRRPGRQRREGRSGGRAGWSETVAAWSALPLPSGSASTSRPSRWTIRSRTRSSSTRCSGTRRSSSRRASPRDSGSPWPRRCGRAVRSSRAPWGIVDQVIDGETGILVGDPRDLEGFGAAVELLLREPVVAERLGRNADPCGAPLPRRPAPRRVRHADRGPARRRVAAAPRNVRRDLSPRGPSRVGSRPQGPFSVVPDEPPAPPGDDGDGCGEPFQSRPARAKGGLT